MKQRTLKKRIVLLAGKLTFAGLVRLSRWLDLGKTERWGKRLGNFIYHASKRYRQVALKNLRNSFPDWSEKKVHEVARETFQHFARGTFEFFYMMDLPTDEMNKCVTVEGIEHIEAARANGKGAVIVTAHLGNWELFARKIVSMHYPVNVIARDSDDPTMTGIANRIRQGAGYKVLSRDNSALPAFRCLRKNELLGILPDQNTFTGIFVDFFGRPVATATGPAVFSLKTGAPIICGFARRLKEGGFKVVIYPPLDIPLTGDETADTVSITAALNRVIEDEIRKDPAQWLWLHDRWRRTHEAPGWSAATETSS